MVGKDLIMATLFGSGGGSGGGGIPQEDIDAAFAALAEKGVTVPDGATSADLDDLIKSIAAGGIEGYNTVQGTFTLSETKTSGKYTINCKRVSPKPSTMYSFVYIVDGYPQNSDTDHLVAAAGVSYRDSSYMNRRGYIIGSTGDGSIPNATSVSGVVGYDGNYSQLTIVLDASKAPIVAGVTYGWLYFYK